MYRRPVVSQRYGPRPSRTTNSRPGPLRWLPRTPPGNTRAARWTSSGASLMIASSRVPPSYARRQQDTGPGEPPRLEQGKGVIGVLQRETSDRRTDRNPRRFGQQLGAVGPRIGSDAADRALVVEIAVGKWGNRAHVNAGERDGAAGREVAQRPRDQISRRREDDDAVGRRRHPIVRLPHPGRAQRARQLAVGRLAR